MKVLWKIGLPVVLGASLAAGFWFGGILERSVSVFAIVVLAAVVLAGDLVGPPDRRGVRIASASAAGLLFVFGWYLAGREIDRAFAECSQRAEGVRTALEGYRRDHGGYPSSLSEISRLEIPGDRILRPGLLKYVKTADGYVLSFRDTHIQNTATDKRGFFEKDRDSVF